MIKATKVRRKTRKMSSQTLLVNGGTEVSRFNSKVTVVLGAQWGDEGKGKVVDMIATDVDVVCRCQVSSTRLFLFMKLLSIVCSRIIYIIGEEGKKY